MVATSQPRHRRRIAGNSRSAATGRNRIAHRFERNIHVTQRQGGFESLPVSSAHSSAEKSRAVPTQTPEPQRAKRKRPSSLDDTDQKNDPQYVQEDPDASRKRKHSHTAARQETKAPKASKKKTYGKIGRAKQIGVICLWSGDPIYYYWTCVSPWDGNVHPTLLPHSIATDAEDDS